MNQEMRPFPEIVLGCRTKKESKKKYGRWWEMAWKEKPDGYYAGPPYNIILFNRMDESYLFSDDWAVRLLNHESHPTRVCGLKYGCKEQPKQCREWPYTGSQSFYRAVDLIFKHKCGYHFIEIEVTCPEPLGC